MNLFIDLNNYKKDGTVYKRTASRAIIKKDNKYLMIYSKYGDYKFPGGGVKEGENLIDTVIREVKEETGYKVIRESVNPFGKVSEKRKGNFEDLLDMVSHYFYCKVEEIIGETNLDDYEKDYNYKYIWITLEKAIEKNEEVKEFDKCPWIIRDTKVMELLANMKEEKN
jgi:8-oxo-dGTP pyrophosphatase MutT (NUDIX family)